MSTRHPRIWIVLALVTGTASVALLYGRWIQQPAGSTYARRAFEVATSAPTMPLDDVEALLERSDEVRRTLAEAGITDVGQEVWDRLQSMEVSHAERLAFYAENRYTIFGGRSYEESAMSVDRLVRIRKVRATLEGP